MGTLTEAFDFYNGPSRTEAWRRQHYSHFQPKPEDFKLAAQYRKRPKKIAGETEKVLVDIFAEE